MAFLLLSIGAFYFLLPFVDFNRNASVIASLFQQIAGGLIGTAVVSISLITFFLQHNLTRLPYSLFSRLSFDWLIISYFLFAFTASLTTGLLSIFFRPELGAEFVLAFFLLSATVVTMLLLSFQRALQLVNPTYQLNCLLKDERRTLKWWSKRVEIARPLFRARGRNQNDRFDYVKRSFFDSNPAWTRSLASAIRHTSAFVRKYADSGDYGVTSRAFLALVALNRLYIHAKGTTFIAGHPLFDQGHSTDGVINESLEQVRQLHAFAAANRDEALLTQCYDVYAQLSEIYAQIDYGVERAEKSHARLAIGYLYADLERAIPLAVPDVLMHGTRLLVRLGHYYALNEDRHTLHQIVDELAKIALTGVAAPQYQPVTSIAIDGLGNLLLSCFVSSGGQLRLFETYLQSKLLTPLQFYLTAKRPESSDTLAYYPKEFFDLTKEASFGNGLAKISNQIISAQEATEEIRNILGNIEHWADRLSVLIRELLKLAIEKRSFAAQQIVQWIEHIARIFIALNSVAFVPAHLTGKLERHGAALVHAFGSIPDDEGAIRYAESLQITDAIFDVALEALERDQHAALKESVLALLLWGVQGAQYGVGWATFERAIFGVAALIASARAKGHPINLRDLLAKRKHLITRIPLEEALRTRDEIAEYRNGTSEERRSHSNLELLIAQANPDAVSEQLTLIDAEWLSPRIGVSGSHQP